MSTVEFPAHSRDPSASPAKHCHFTLAVRRPSSPMLAKPPECYHLQSLPQPQSLANFYLQNERSRCPNQLCDLLEAPRGARTPSHVLYSKHRGTLATPGCCRSPTYTPRCGPRWPQASELMPLMHLGSCSLPAPLLWGSPLPLYPLSGERGGQCPSNLMSR